MTGIDFDCPCCRTSHRETDGSPLRPWPALAFRRPDPYLDLVPAHLHHAQATDDLCIIARPDRTECFIRAVMSFPVVQDPVRRLEYGPWVSVSGGDFDNYVAHYEDGAHRATYSGHLATALPGYEAVDTVPVLVRTRGAYRPMLSPDSTFDHPLVRDFHNGVTREEAELRIRAFLLKDSML